MLSRLLNLNPLAAFLIIVAAMLCPVWAHADSSGDELEILLEPGFEGSCNEFGAYSTLDLPNATSSALKVVESATGKYLSYSPDLVRAMHALHCLADGLRAETRPAYLARAEGALGKFIEARNSEELVLGAYGAIAAIGTESAKRTLENAKSVIFELYKSHRLQPRVINLVVGLGPDGVAVLLDSLKKPYSSDEIRETIKAFKDKAYYGDQKKLFGNSYELLEQLMRDETYPYRFELAPLLVMASYERSEKFFLAALNDTVDDELDYIALDRFSCGSFCGNVDQRGEIVVPWMTQQQFMEAPKEKLARGFDISTPIAHVAASTKNYKTHLQALRILSCMGPFASKGLDVAERSLKSSNPEERKAALKIFKEGARSIQDYIPTLTEEFKESTELDERVIILEALVNSRVTDKRTFATFIAALGVGDHNLANTALRGLVPMKDRANEAWPSVLKYYVDSYPKMSNTQTAGLEDLSNLGPLKEPYQAERLDILRHFLETNDKSIFSSAVYHITNVKSVALPLLPVIVTSMRRLHSFGYMYGVQTVSHDDQVMGVIEEAIKSQNEYDRSEAIGSLAFFNDRAEQATILLENGYARDTAYNQQQRARALKRLNHPVAQAALERLAHRDKTAQVVLADKSPQY